MSVLTLLLQHIEERTPATLDALRRAVVEDETFDAATGWYPRAEALVAADRHDEAIRRIDAHMPGAFCCPQAHALLAQSLAAIGRDEEAARERTLAVTALELILDSGDGTPDRPWQVWRTLDEYAVLSAQSSPPVGQRLVAVGERRLDVHELADGTECCFEVVRA